MRTESGEVRKMPRNKNTQTYKAAEEEVKRLKMKEQKKKGGYNEVRTVTVPCPNCVSLEYAFQDGVGEV